MLRRRPEGTLLYQIVEQYWPIFRDRAEQGGGLPGLRYAMGYDRRLCSDVLAAFVNSLRRSLRHRAKHELGLRSVMGAQIGAITLPELKTRATGRRARAP